MKTTDSRCLRNRALATCTGQPLTAGDTCGCGDPRGAEENPHLCKKSSAGEAAPLPVGLAAWAVTRSGRARPVCDSGRGSGIGEPRGLAARCRGPAGVWGAVARGTEVWPAGWRAQPGLRGARGTGRGDGTRSGRMPSTRRRSRGGVRGRSPRNFTPARRPPRGGLGPGKLCSPPSRAEPRLGAAGAGGGGRRGDGQALFVSFHFLRQPLAMRTAGLRRSGRGPRE